MDAYSMMPVLHGYPWCWACGRGEQHRPQDWYGPWLIERAHIVHGRAIKQTRYVNLLCSLCHRRQHGIELSGWNEPQLTLANMLWLKLHFDPKHYDRDAYQAISVGKLPRATVSRWHREQYILRRGERCFPETSRSTGS